MPKLDKLSVSGFKSIRQQELELGALNVLIGANGAGKSNLIGVFRLLHDIVNEDLQVAVARAGGANNLLHFGRKQTDEIKLRFQFGRNAYLARLCPNEEDSLFFAEELVYFRGQGYKTPFSDSLGEGHQETRLIEHTAKTKRTTIADHVLRAVRSWRIYHFHDTSRNAPPKQTGELDDNERLRSDAGNLAAFLYRLQETDTASYRDIVETVRMMAPFFADFNLRPDPLNPGKIKLAWKERGSDSYFGAQALSDGTLRFICLTTLLLQPNLPTTVLIDEPELGLHPYAIHLLADMFRAASQKTQLVVSTQSVTLVNQLAPEDLIVVDRKDGESIFSRLSEEQVARWLNDYGLGELWEKNLLGGRPAASSLAS